MGPEADQIERHIQDTREHLGENIRELERRVKTSTDWRYQFRHHALGMMGAAFGAGILLASLFRRRACG